MSNSPDSLVGLRIAALRAMTEAEMLAEGWVSYGPVTVLVLEDGTKLYAAKDAEGNGPGALFGLDQEGAFRVQVPPSRVFMVPKTPPKRRTKKSATA